VEQSGHGGNWYFRGGPWNSFRLIFFPSHRTTTSCLGTLGVGNADPKGVFLSAYEAFE